MKIARPNYTKVRAELSPCGRFRFVLSREWKTGEKLRRLCWIMLNPSTADAAKDDPTIRKCVGFAKRWGYDAIDVVNLFALRTPHPRELKRTSDLHGPREADKLIADTWLLFSAAMAEKAVVAWGAHGTLFQRDRVVIDMLAGVELWCIGTNADGTPRHPLMAPYQSPLIRYESARAAANVADQPAAAHVANEASALMPDIRIAAAGGGR